jgi:hypothetical protein
MLAYIFWHAPYVDIDVLDYEEALLMADPPAEPEASAAYRISEVPWLNGLAGFGDWCFMTSSAALDTLNNAAVRPERWNVHAAVSSKQISDMVVFTTICTGPRNQLPARG